MECLRRLSFVESCSDQSTVSVSVNETYSDNSFNDYTHVCPLVSVEVIDFEGCRFNLIQLFQFFFFLNSSGRS
jgi:hypothetical protein